MFDWILSAFFVWTCFLTWRVWLYRKAIIRLQADMAGVLDELTRPALKVPLRVVKPAAYDPEAHVG